MKDISKISTSQITGSTVESQPSAGSTTDADMRIDANRDGRIDALEQAEAERTERREAERRREENQTQPTLSVIQGGKVDPSKLTTREETHFGDGSTDLSDVLITDSNIIRRDIPQVTREMGAFGRTSEAVDMYAVGVYTDRYLIAPSSQAAAGWIAAQLAAAGLNQEVPTYFAAVRSASAQRIADRLEDAGLGDRRIPSLERRAAA